MKIEHIKDLLHVSPFEPFTLHTADGGEVEVPHPDFAAVSGRQMIVLHEHNYGSERLDINLIRRVTVAGAEFAPAES